MKLPPARAGFVIVELKRFHPAGRPGDQMYARETDAREDETWRVTQ